MPERESENLRYARKILLTGCLLYGSIVGIIVNCNGQFFSYIAQALGVSVGKVTFDLIIVGVTSFFTTSVVTGLFQHRNARTVAILSILLYTGSQLSMAFVRTLWQLYLAACLKGVCHGFLLYYVTSALIKAWYGQKAGTALSIAAFSSGVIGIFSNLLVGVLIEYSGWRTALVVSTVCAALVSLPCVCLFLYRDPGEREAALTGRESSVREKAPEPVKVRKKYPMKQFLIGLVIVVFWLSCGSYYPHLKVYSADAGLSQMTGAVLMSVSMSGNLVFKLLIGILSDRLGTVRTAVAFSVLAIIGFLALAWPLGTASYYLGAFLLGEATAFPTVLTPEVVSLVYKGEDFRIVHARYTRVLSLTGALTSGVLGIAYSAFGSYRPQMVTGALMMAAGIVLVLLFTGSGKEPEKAA